MAHGRLGLVLSRWRARGRTLPLVVTMTLAAGMTGGALVLTAVPAAAAAVTGGAGASLAYTELQTESASTNGTVIGPSYTQGQLPDEASGPPAVPLARPRRHLRVPLPPSANSLSITSYGADPTGAADSSNAFSQAISAAQAQGRTVWIPSGTFQVNQHIIVNNVTIQGAGMWYSVVQGNGVGFYGNYAPNPSSNVHLSNFAIFGNVQDRNDGAQVNGIGGALANSTVSNTWIEHTKLGAWIDGPFDGLTFSGMRIRDTTADGINFHNGITHSSVTQSDLRNLGDDGLATWADTNADAFDSFTNNTVQLPMLANGIAIYGGHDNTVSGNRVVDAGINQGGGIHVAHRFNSTPLGATTATKNTIIPSGY